jgi:hypothetical protein
VAASLARIKNTPVAAIKLITKKAKTELNFGVDFISREFFFFFEAIFSFYQ